MARHPWVAAADEGVRFGVQAVLGEEPMASLLEAGQLVERLGFDGLFVFDHPSIHPDPWVCLSALAVVTERVRLGSVVNCVPYRHPVHLARLAADLDNLSGGRLVLGVGVGWLEAEFRALGVPFRPVGERLGALEEALTVIQGAWGPRPFTFAGRHYAVEEVRVAPPPVRRPPILIGGGGERVTLRQVARFADACNVSELQPADGKQDRVGGADTVRRKLGALRAHCADVGRPADEVLRTHFTLRLIIAPDESALAAKLAAAEARISGSPGTRRARPSAWVTGTPDQVSAYYREMAEVGVQYFVVQVDVADHETIELLGGEVMPRLRSKNA